MSAPINTSEPSAHGDRVSKQVPGNELSAAQRCFSLAELIAGSAIVIGHNVYHVVPNEVGLHSRPRVHRYVWRDHGVFWLVSSERVD